MITAVLILLPFLFGLFCFLCPENKVKYLAFATSLIVFGVSAYMAKDFCLCYAIQHTLNYPWIPSMGISFNLGLDGISLLLVLLTTFLVPLIILSSFRHEYKNSRLFYALILFMQGALIGVFAAGDAFLFYVFWELALIPIYFICLLWGGNDRLRITFKFFIYTLSGSLFMLLAIIYLYLQTPERSFDITAFYSLKLDTHAQYIVFWAFFLAFAIKMPIFPLHTWQPDTYHTAPTQGTMLLSGIMLKMGIYGVIRWMIPIVPEAILDWGKLVIILSICGIVYASVIAIMQKDFKRLIAYSSIAHIGLIAAGIFSNTLEGLQGAVVQMLSHGITVVGMFFIVDIIYDRTKTHQISALSGIRNSAPQFALFFIIILLGSVALPFTSGFIGEFLLFIGIYKYNGIYAGIAGTSIILGAVYMLTSYQKMILGESNTVSAGFKDLYPIEKAVLIPIVILIFAIGIYPNIILEVSEPAVKMLFQAASEHYTMIK